MWPVLSDGTRQQFSSCSRESVGSLLASTSCHADAVDLSISTDAVSNTDVRISISNLSSDHTASGVQVAIESSVAVASLPGECSKVSQSTINCRITSLNTADTHAFPISLSRPLANGETLLAEVSLTSAIDVETANNAVELEASGTTRNVNDPGIELPDDTFTLNKTKNLVSTGSGSINPIDTLFIICLLALWRRRGS